MSLRQLNSVCLIRFGHVDNVSLFLWHPLRFVLLCVEVALDILIVCVCFYEFCEFPEVGIEIQNPKMQWWSEGDSQIENDASQFWYL